MHPVQYHLTKKLVWMSRQLRVINDAAANPNWTGLMTAVKELLVEAGKKELREIVQGVRWKSFLTRSTQQGCNVYLNSKESLAM